MLLWTLSVALKYRQDPHCAGVIVLQGFTVLFVLWILKKQLHCNGCEQSFLVWAVVRLFPVWLADPAGIPISPVSSLVFLQACSMQSIALNSSFRFYSVD